MVWQASLIKKVVTVHKKNAVDKEIDKLVYKLSRKGMIYGLTEDEIKIIESG